MHKGEICHDEIYNETDGVQQQVEGVEDADQHRRRDPSTLIGEPAMELAQIGKVEHDEEGVRELRIDLSHLAVVKKFAKTARLLVHV